MGDPFFFLLLSNIHCGVSTLLLRLAAVLLDVCSSMVVEALCLYKYVVMSYVGNNLSL